MRSERVVLPESMWAEIPMLRMRSMFAFATSAFLKVPEKGGLQLPRIGTKNQAAGRPTACRCARAPIVRTRNGCAKRRFDAPNKHARRQNPGWRATGLFTPHCCAKVTQVELLQQEGYRRVGTPRSGFRFAGAP